MATTNEKPESPADPSDNQPVSVNYCSISRSERLRPGMLCSRCKNAKIEYDGMLNLVCPNCGLTETGAFT